MINEAANNMTQGADQRTKSQVVRQLFVQDTPLVNVSAPDSNQFIILNAQ